MLAGMAHHIFTSNLQDQGFIDRFCQGMDAGTMPQWAKGKESFKDYILGTTDGQPKTPEWAAEICGVKAEDIAKLAQMYATTKPAALKASWAPGRNAYGEQYNRKAATEPAPMVITTSPSFAAARIAAGIAAISSTKTGSIFPATRSARTSERASAATIGASPAAYTSPSSSASTPPSTMTKSSKQSRVRV